MSSRTRIVGSTLVAGFLGLVALGAACSGAETAEETTARVAEAGGSTVGGIATDSGNTDNPPPEDINADLACTPTGPLGPVASGTLTNHSSAPSNYTLSVNFTDAAGTIVANGTGFVTNVPAGGTARWEAQSLAMGVTAAGCNVAEVNRLAA